MTDPIEQLRQLGTLKQQRRVAYRALGLTPAHIPALLDLLADTALWEADEEPQMWAVIHAIRALGELRAIEAIPQLIRCFKEDDDSSPREAAQALGRIGPAALPALRPVLFARLNPFEMRSVASEAIGAIAEHHPEARAQCIAALTAQLQQFRASDRDLNGWLIGDLLEMKAVESAAVMEAAFTRGCVALSVCGDWEDVQVELGLLAKRHTPRPRYYPE